MRHKKDSRLTKRLSSNAQLVDIANQELELKKRILEKVEEGDKRHEEHMKMFTEDVYEDQFFKRSVTRSCKSLTYCSPNR